MQGVGFELLSCLSVEIGEAPLTIKNKKALRYRAYNVESCLKRGYLSLSF
jgi:hypothetical protein